MSPRLPSNESSDDATTPLNCLRIVYDKWYHASTNLTQSDALRLSASWAVGAVTFPTCLGLLQKFVFAPLQISNSNPFANIFGMFAVAVSGVIASKVMGNVWDLAKDDESVVEAAETSFLESPETLFLVAGTSVSVFVLLRGKFSSVLPSDVLTPGAFGKVNLPASENYATTSKRLQLQVIGKKNGCHSCGSRHIQGEFIADHQPPLAIVKRKTSKTKHLLYRILKFFRKKTKYHPVQQKFYPQCNSCSNVQLTYLSAVSRGLKTPRHLVTHSLSLRLYHIFTPIPLLLASAYSFCTSEN